MIYRMKLLTLVVSLFVLTKSATGQENLIEIYQRALQNDPVIREAEANYLAMLEVKPQARSAVLPSLTLSAGASIGDSTNPNPATNFMTGEPSRVVVSSESRRDSSDWSVALTQTLYNRGQFIALRQADKQVARAEVGYQLAKQDLLLRVSETYFNVLAAEDTVASEQAAREAIRRQLEQAEQRFEVGLIAITDVQEAQAGFDQAVAAEISAQRLLATSIEFLREIIGSHVTDLAGPKEDFPLISPNPADQEAWVRTALDQNLALISNRIGTEIAQDSIEIERSTRLPTLRLSGNFGESQSESTRINNLASGLSPRTFSEFGSEGYSFNLSFSVPIYSGGFNASRIRQSVYQHRAALEGLERMARQTERLTRDAYLGVLSEISRVRALRQAVESSETALRATEAGFEVGTRTTVDVLASQNNLRRAQTNFARSRYDYALEVLNLKYAAGSLAVQDLELVNEWLE